MKKLLLSVILIELFVSCNKVLDVKPVSVITNNTYWKTNNDAEGALNGMYVDLRSEAVADLFIFGEARSGDMTSALAGSLGYDIYYNNTLNSNTVAVTWAGLYKVINDANLIIKHVPGIAFTSQSEKSNILAQAYTMRAYCYFTLAKTWGGVPLRLIPTESYDPLTIQKSQATEQEVFQQIKSDIANALNLYPNDNYPTGRCNWSRPATNALKADVFLWTAKLMNGGTSDLNTALDAVDSIQQSNAQLLPDYSSIFAYNNKGNNEVIMAVHFQTLESPDNYYLNMFFHSSNITNDLTPGELDTIGVVGSNSNSVWQVAPFIRAQFSTDDQRRLGTFYEVYTKEGAFYASMTTKGLGDIENGVRYFTNDIILYRYGGILLLKAEIENALGMDPSKEINMVRQRAYGSNFNQHIFVSGSQEYNDSLILKERLLELTTEGKRWWDLIRFGKVFELDPSLQGDEGQNWRLLFPIPQNILSLEPQVKQNPGW